MLTGTTSNTVLITQFRNLQFPLKWHHVNSHGWAVFCADIAVFFVSFHCTVFPVFMKKLFENIPSSGSGCIVDGSGSRVIKSKLQIVNPVLSTSGFERFVRKFKFMASLVVVRPQQQNSQMVNVWQG